MQPFSGDGSDSIKFWRRIWPALEATEARPASSVPKCSASTNCTSARVTDILDEWRQDMPVPVHLHLFRNQPIARRRALRSAPKAHLLGGSSPPAASSFSNPNSRKQTYPRSLISPRVRTRTSSVPRMRQTSSSLRLGCASAWNAILNGISRSVFKFELCPPLAGQWLRGIRVLPLQPRVLC